MAKPNQEAAPQNGNTPPAGNARAEMVKAERAKLKAAAYVLRCEAFVVALERDKFPTDGAPYKAALALVQAMRDAAK